MSRKDFRALAEAISSIKDSTERERIMQLIGEVCQSTNVNFDWSRWYIACNVFHCYEGQGY